MKKKIAYGFLAVIIIIQFFRIDKTNPKINKADDFIKLTQAPKEIAAILKTSCYDCHSDETNYPWYSNIAPVSWWLKHHIDEAREELNFSKWSTFSEKKKKHILEEMGEEVEENEMPLSSYTLSHSEAKLSKEQKAQFMEWIKFLREEKKIAKKKTLHLNNGEKWITNLETSAGIKRMIAIASEDIEEGRISHYAAMGQKLNIEMKRIFAECTMEGEAHEQLHFYLLPMVKDFRELEEVSSEEDGMIKQKDILKSLNKYNEFFTTE